MGKLYKFIQNFSPKTKKGRDTAVDERILVTCILKK